MAGEIGSMAVKREGPESEWVGLGIRVPFRLHQWHNALMSKLPIIPILFAWALATLPVDPARSAEPTYQNKSLSKWLEVYTEAKPDSPEERQAREAVRAIGTNAVPYLIKMVAKDDLTIQS